MSDRRVELSDFETASLYASDLSDILREGYLLERKRFMKSFVKEIGVTGNEAVLTY